MEKFTKLSIFSSILRDHKFSFFAQSTHICDFTKKLVKNPISLTFVVKTHTPPCGRLADRNRNRNRNEKPQLDNRNTQNVINFFWKIFHKIFTFFIWTPITSTLNSLKLFKFLRKVNLHCRKCKNMQNSLLKQIFCKVLSLNKTSGLHNNICNDISKVCTSLA